MILKDKNASSLVDEEANERSSLLNIKKSTYKMKLSNIIIEQHLKDGSILLESICQNLTQEQSRIVKGIYNEFKPLIEASLSQDQILQVFTGVEQQATGAGNNRTLIGKGVDLKNQVNDIINKTGQWLQNTAPVQFADQKFEELKTKVAAKFPALDRQLTDLGTWMKDNPGKSAAIIGVLTAIASLAGGPAGGAIAGQALRGAAELIKGEKLSTAVGKGIKTAALGYLSGKAFELLGNWMAGFREQAIPFGPEDAGLEKISWGATKTLRAPGTEWTQSTQGFNALVRPEEASAIREAMTQIKQGDLSSFDSLLAIGKQVHSKEYKQALDGMVAGAWEAAKSNDSILQFINVAKQGLQATAQGAVAASTGSKSTPKTESLSKSTINKLFYNVDRANMVLDEGLFDKIKQFGQNLTTKITADKLKTAWTKAGSPTDSDQVAQILKQAGVNDTIISKVFGDMNISYSGKTPPSNNNQTVNTQEIVTRIRKLTPAQQKEILALLGK